MVNIVIFGTGTSGMRALRAARGFSDIDAIGFADNDTAQHGKLIKGIRVYSPKELENLQVDYIIIASQFAHDIRKGLLDQYFSDSMLILPDLRNLTNCMQKIVSNEKKEIPITFEDGQSIHPSSLPKILILTYETLNGSHGTGVVIQRYFRKFPIDSLFSICHHKSGEPWLSNNLTLQESFSHLQKICSIRDALASKNFRPDLVYSTAFSEVDLDVLSATMDVLPDICIIQHFMDYMPHDKSAFDAIFLSLSQRVTDIWALTEGMARELSKRYGRAVQHMNALHQDPSQFVKDEYADFDCHFRSVIIGNFWQPWLLPVIDRAWCRCMQTMHGLRPIEWYAHPMRVQAMIEAGYSIGDGIQWKGFVSASSLQKRLSSAELAILPFNGSKTAQNDYSKFSLPSRMTEFCGAGLPIAVIASPDTEPANFINSRECGVRITGNDEVEIADGLMTLITNRRLREKLGKKARKVAETEFAFESFEIRLVAKLIELAKKNKASAGRQYGLYPSNTSSFGSFNSEIAGNSLVDRVHYACGSKIFSGWLNVEGFDYSCPDGEVPPDLAGKIFLIDLTGSHPFPDDHFKLGYSEDFIERIDQHEFVIFLCEVYRTFKRGGVLRLSTPELTKTLKKCFRGADWNVGNICREEAYTRCRHKHYLCVEEIETIAYHIGWRDVRVCRYGVSTVDGLAKETMPDQSNLNLVVELIK